MKRNKSMFVSGLLLVIGSAILLPLAGFGVFVLMGDEHIDKIAGLDREYLPVVAVAAVGAAVLIPLAGIFLMTGSILIPYFSSRRENRRIISEGQPAEARILALTDTGTRINNDPLVSFLLEVRSPTRPPFQTEVRQTVSVIHLPSYQPGRILTVKYLPGTDKVAITGTKID